MGWISVKDRLPPANQEVLVCDRWDTYIAQLYLCGHADWQEVTSQGVPGGLSRITHWQSLPELQNKE